MSELIQAARAALKDRHFAEAEAAAMLALESSPECLSALRVAGEALARQGKLNEAISILERLVRRSPEDAQAINYLASLCWQAGEYQKSANYCSNLIQLQPDNAHVWNSRGLCLLALNCYEESVEAFGNAIRLNAQVTAFHHNMAIAKDKIGQLEDAEHAYRRALQIDPKAADSLSALADLSIRMAKSGAAMELLTSLRQIRNLSNEEEVSYGAALLAMDQLARARDHLMQVLAADPNHAGAHSLLATILQRQGEHVLAEKELRTSIAANPRYPMPYWQITQGRKIVEADRAMIDDMEALEQEPSISSSDLAVLRFALAKSYDDLGEYENAMKHFDAANKLQKQMNQPFDADEYAAGIDNIVEFFSKDFVRSLAPFSSPSDQPLFVVGMYRSGTTLTEQILSSHPQVAGAGEIDFWPDKGSKTFNRWTRSFDPQTASALAGAYLERLLSGSGDALRVVDKHPLNYYHVGLIHALFPRARFVFCLRNSLDSCLSIYMTYFRKGPSFMHDKANLAFGYRQHLRLMNHWQRLLPGTSYVVVQYEDLVENTERISRRLIDFAGLPWEDACLHPERNERVVSTASHWQVRQPIYKTSIERWRRYEPWLGDLAVLADIE